MYSKSSAQGCPKAREAADGVVAVFAVSTLVAVFAAFDIITWALVAKLAVFAVFAVRARGSLLPDESPYSLGSLLFDIRDGSFADDFEVGERVESDSDAIQADEAFQLHHEDFEFEGGFGLDDRFGLCRRQSHDCVFRFRLREIDIRFICHIDLSLSRQVIGVIGCLGMGMVGRTVTTCLLLVIRLMSVMVLMVWAVGTSPTDDDDDVTKDDAAENYQQ